MLQKKIAVIIALSLVFSGYAQDSTQNKFLEISGSVDAYYKYDFAKTPNISTYFGSDQNSVSIGMIDVMLKKTTGRASFVGELSFGPRGQYQSLVNGDGNESNASNSFHVQNLYINYAVSDKFTLTAGYMGTFIGYEVISPAANFNYSTSYLFGAGPFQNAGIKGTYAFSEKLSLMAGLFNDWNVYSATRGVSAAGAQLMIVPVPRWSVYLNALTGLSAYNEYHTLIDLTTAYQVTDAFKLGLNAANYSPKSGEGGYNGVALYPQYAFTPTFTLGARVEYFNYKGGTGFDNASLSSFTLSGNIKAGGLTLIPEIRFDNDSDFTQGFVDKNGAAAKSAGQFILAAVYAF